jgi:D-alanine-D-alanine ligase
MQQIPSDLKQKTVGVFFGGQSPEHDISIVTGLLVLNELEKLGIATEPIYIATDGSWCLGETLRSREYVQNIHTQNLYPLQRWAIETKHRSPHLILTRRPNFFSRRITKKIDIAFPAFHGAYGEDGAVQGLFELLGVPYVGSGVEGCSIAMNKALAKQFFESLHIKTTAFISLTDGEWQKSSAAVFARTESLSYPLFVKPAHAGSSIGISRVQNKEALSSAIEVALGFDSTVVIENGVAPMVDLTCCLREKEDGNIEASLVQESNFGKSDFFSYQEKYLEGGGVQFGSAEKQVIIPARIPGAVAGQIQSISKQVFAALNLSGISRVDFLYNPATSELFANEVNPMPGTLYHHLWKKSGVESSQLVVGLLRAALRKHSTSLKKNAYFSSSILSIMKGNKLSK